MQWLDDEREAAEERKRKGLPANLQEAGEAFHRAAEREGVGATYVRQLQKIIEHENAEKREKLLDAIRSRGLRIDQAARELVGVGDDDDPDTWLTPPYILDAARAEIGGQPFDLDPCTILRNPAGAKTFYSKQRNDNGLALPWNAENIWINPPYSAILPWIEKSVEAVRNRPNTRIWMLIPGATETAYGQRALRTASAACFLGDRVHHLRPSDGKPAGSPRWGSMVIGFGAATLAGFADLGVTLPGGAVGGLRAAA
ncbi:MAG: DNA N-6-adenine-methyltransferase [Vulcanimicrobiaceae bacterium]